MRQHFYIFISITLWLIMMVGFSDNWLTDIGQPSHSEPKLMIQAVFAFSWFTMLFIQNVLIRKQNIKAHMKAGKTGFVIYLGFLLSTLPLYLKELSPCPSWCSAS